MQRLVADSLVLVGACLLGTCRPGDVVNPPSGGLLVVSPPQLVDSAALGSRAARVMTVAISNANGGELAWTTKRLNASPWLSLGATSGTAPATLDVVGDPTGLAAGVYSDVIVVTATSPARGEVGIPVQFVIHPCEVEPISPDVEVAGRLDRADCAGPHRGGTFADLYNFTGSAGDSVSVELESAEFAPYLILDTATTPSAPPLAESGTCAYAPARRCLRYQRLPRSGTFVIEATSAVAGDSGAYQLRLLRPRPPSFVDSLTQLRGDSMTAITTGGVSADSTIVLRGTASDPDGGDSLRLEVEVRPVNAGFTGVATATGALVPAGGRVLVRVSDLSDNTAFHWRARVVDQTGRAGGWMDYGGNPEFAADVSVAIEDGPTAPTGLGQFKSDSLAPLAVGGTTDEVTAVFKGTVLDPDPGDSVRLDVEVRAVGTPLSGVPTAASVRVASGEEATVAITGLADNTFYHWQARAVDQSGRASAWAAFGGNPEAAPDFYVRVPPTQLVFTEHPVTTASGATITPAVQVAAQDGEGNTLASFTAPIAIALGSNLASGTLSGTRTVNAVAGVATFADLSIDEAGGGYTLVASATGPAAATSDAFSITSGPAVRLAITTEPSGTAQSGVALSQQPAIQLLDAAGNAVTYAGAAVEATIASGGGTLGGTTTVLSHASGVAAFTDLVITGTVGPHTLGFTGTALDGVTSSTVTVTAGAAAILVPFSGDNLTGEVGSTLDTPHDVWLTDINGNPVGGVAVTWIAATGGGSVNPTLAVTDADGHATTIRTLGLTAGPQTTTAAAALSGGATTVTFHIAATVGGATQMSIEGGDNQVDTVGQLLPRALAVRVADQFNNPVPDVQISWAVLDGGGAVNPLSSLTDASGIATTSWTLGTAMAPTDSVQLVRATGVGSPQTFTAFTVPGAVSATQTSVTAFPATIGASSGSSASTLTVTVRDAFGNVIKGQPVVLAATGSGIVLTQPATPTDANGVATGTLSAATAGDKVISATIAGTGVTQTATVTVMATEVSAVRSTVAAAPGMITASSGADSATITVTARDPFGNPIEGATVVLVATGSGTALTQPGTPTDANGVATGTLSATTAGDKVISATIAGTGVTQTVAVTVTPAGVSAAQSAVAASPGSITAGSGVATVTVTARDPFGNPIEGATVVLAATGTGNALTQPATTTNASGVATGSLGSTGAEDKVVSATIAGTDVTQTATVMVTPAGVSAAQSTVVAGPGSIAAGSGVATITVTARDQFDNPIAGATVILTATGSGNTLTQPGVPTDANGVATGTLSATTAEPKIVSATIAGTGVTQTAAVTVLPFGVSAAQSTVAAAPGTITASTGASTTTLTVTARDPFDNPIAGAPVIFNATGSGNTLTQPGATTDAHGVATGTLSATTAGDKVVSATIAGTGVTQTATVRVMAAAVDAAQSTVTASPGTITASSGASSATITVTARDAFGNSIAGATVVLAATGSGNTLTQPETTTDASGVATGTLSATVSATKVVSAVVDGTPIAQTASVVVTAGTATKLLIATEPSATAQSGVALATQPVVQLRDVNDNNVSQSGVVATASIASGLAGATLVNVNATTSSDGVATFSGLAIGGPVGSYRLQISAGELTPATTTALMLSPGPAAQLVVTTPPSGAAQSGVALSQQPVIQLQDAAGNAVSHAGATVEAAIASGGGTLGGTTTVLTDASGVAAFTDLMLTGLVGPRTLQFGATGLTGVLSGAVDLTAGPPSQVAVDAGDGQSATAGTAVAVPPSVIVRDASGNPVSGVAVTFAAAPGNGTVSPVTPVLTDANGVAAVGAWTLGTVAGTDSLTATTSPALAGSPVVVTATATVGAPATLVPFSGDNLTGEVGSTLDTPHDVWLTDINGNPVGGVAVTWIAATGGGSVNPTLAVTDADGHATTIRTLGLTAGPQTTTAAAALSGGATTVTFHIAATVGGATQMSIEGGDNQVDTVGQLLPSALAVRVADQFNNPVPNVQISWAVLDGGGAVTPLSSLTDASGIATTSWTLGTAMAPTDSVQLVRATGVGSPQTFTAFTVPGAVSATQTSVTAFPATLGASSGSSASTLTVTVRDAFGNVIKGQPVVLAATGSGTVLTQPATPTDANGVATGTLSATTAEPKTITATVGGVGITQVASVLVIPAGAQDLVFLTQPTSVAAGASFAPPVEVEIRDQFANRVTSATHGVALALATNPAGGTLSGGGTVAAVGGVATFTGLSLDKVGVGYTLAASSPGLTGATSVAFTVTAGAVSPALSTLAAAPGSITAGGAAATITVMARDALGNPTEGAAVVLAATGTGNTLTQPGTTDANGVATGSLSATTAEPKIVSATINGTGVTQTATVIVTAAAMSATQSTVEAAPGTIPASSGASSATITVTARDPFGNPIAGATAVLAATGSGTRLTQPAGPTGANGVATGTFSATLSGPKVVSAVVDGTPIAQTASVIVTPALPCLSQTGPTITVSGLQTAFDNTNMASNTKVDASTALFAGGANVPVRLGGGSRICFSGGAIIGSLPPSTTWSVMHDTYAMAVKPASAVTIENVRIFDYGDGPTMDAAADTNWTIRGSYFKYMRDDCIENDFLVSGLIDDSFLDGCYGAGVSSREFTSVSDGSNNVVVMQNSLMRLQAMDRAFFGPVPNHEAFWKWSGSIGPKVALYDNVFRADQPSMSDNRAGIYMAPPPGKLADCENNVMVWLGPGSFPEALPTTFNGKPCFRLLTGAEGLQYWNDAVAQWKANHPAMLVDAGAPIVSLFSPGIVGSTTLTGTVSLTATAVDDQDVAGVQFQIDGQNIGAEVTQEAPTTKFTLVWDSWGTPDGTYTLTATARDAAGRTTTAAGILVTISNSTVVAAPDTITASNGESSATITVTARDPLGNPIEGATVVLAVTGAGTTLTQPATTTNASGAATGTLSATAAGDKIVSVTIDGTGVTQTATVTVEAASVDAAQSTVAAAPESIAVGSGVSTIAVTALDPFGNPIEGATVVLAATGTGTLLTQPAGPTGANGMATGTLSASLSGPKIVSAAIDGTPIAQTASVTVPPPPGSVVLVGAGDIADCGTSTDEATAQLLDGIPGTVFTAGDNAYPDGSASDFTTCYEPTWGRHKARTRPSPGNHDYQTSGASAYFAYFGASAGPAGQGYYSYDLGDWHVISLNSEISMSAGSGQEQWLRADLAANTKQCTLAYWHQPRFSSGVHGSLVESKPLWAALQEYDAEVVVVGHDHNYERFAPQDSIGVADPARGLRQFVVGTGGTALRGMNSPIANSEVRNTDTHGVLKLTLHGSGYEWEFTPVAGKTFTDSGSGSCH